MSDYFDVYDNEAMKANANYSYEKPPTIYDRMSQKVYKSHESFSEPDMVNHPNHYTVGGVETLDVIEAKLSQSEFQGYCLGNILKYLMRAGYKGKQLEDLKKAQFYLNRHDRDWETHSGSV